MFRKRNKISSALLVSIKREIGYFHVVVLQKRQRNAQKSGVLFSNFHEWLDKNGIVFSKELIEWFRTFWDFKLGRDLKMGRLLLKKAIQMCQFNSG